MKLWTKGLILIPLLIFAVYADGACVLRLTFDSAPVVNAATYTFAVNDIPSSGTVHRYFRGLPGSVRDYGLVWDGSGGFDPVLNYTDSGIYPDIVTPSVPGFQGGNALYTAMGTTDDPTTHNGWYIDRSNEISIDGNFTAEAIVMFATIASSWTGPGTTPPFGSEHGLQNVFGNEAIQTGGAMWKFRHNTISAGMELVTQNTVTGFGETNLLGPQATAMTWYHLACVYTAATNNLEFFVNGVSAGTIQPTWASTFQNHWWVAEWPPNPATRGLAGWLDAVALSDEALAPNQFVLSYPGHTDVDEWIQY